MKVHKLRNLRKIGAAFVRRKGRRLNDGSNVTIDILSEFPLYVAHGFGARDVRARLTMQCINNVIPSLSNFAKSNEHHDAFEFELREMLAQESVASRDLAVAFTKFGSDKSTIHNYDRLYAGLLAGFPKPRIFEIGLGTPNMDVVSTMGASGNPGGSLRAFRSCYPGSELFGADFDKRILFREDRIETFFVDQTRRSTFDDIAIDGLRFDLMIDDGLHAPHANLNSLEFFLPRLSDGGFAVIEDIGDQVIPLWRVVRSLLSPEFRAALFKTQAANVFVVQRWHDLTDAITPA